MIKLKDIKVNKKVVAITGGLVGVSLLGLLVYQYRKRKEAEAKVSKGPTSTPSTASVKPTKFSCTSRDYPLNYGTCHEDVGILQDYLIEKGADLGHFGLKKDGVDNMFGRVTKEAAQQYLGKTSFTEKDIDQLDATG